MLKDYGIQVQQLFLEMMLEDAQSYVRQWGCLATLLHIMQARHTGRIRIEMARKRLEKKL